MLRLPKLTLGGEVVTEPLRLLWQTSQRVLDREVVVARNVGSCHRTAAGVIADALWTTVLTVAQDPSTQGDHSFPASLPGR